MTINHPEYSAMLATAAANPLDPVPRGALADWLDEHGQAELATLMRTRGEPKKMRCLTALGDICVVIPPTYLSGWMLAVFGQSGKFRCMRLCDSEEDASRQRGDIFALHRKIANEKRKRR